MDYSLLPADIERYMEIATVWQEELDEITDSTREKIRIVTQRMLREADFVTPENILQPALLSRDLIRAIREDSIEHLLIFPIAPADLEGND